MLSFRINDAFFTLRTAAVIIRSDSILLHRAEGNDFWSLPGGRIEPMESSADALIREMKEELKVNITISRLLWIVEYFYREDMKDNHEIGFYYLAQLPKSCAHLDGPGAYVTQDGGTKLEFRWHSTHSLDSLHLYPRFLKTALLALPQKPEYIVFRDPSLNGKKEV